ncbi:hypothetical protein BJF78_36270 [Pseudonocardia sp. CNS-139]|nr:hypothetical protein BJF78_36270 [Pseudonocardia sp. CNS-139]
MDATASRSTWLTSAGCVERACGTSPPSTERFSTSRRMRVTRWSRLNTVASSSGSSIRRSSASRSTNARETLACRRLAIRLKTSGFCSISRATAAAGSGSREAGSRGSRPMRDRVPARCPAAASAASARRRTTSAVTTATRTTTTLAATTMLAATSGMRSPFMMASTAAIPPAMSTTDNSTPMRSIFDRVFLRRSAGADRTVPSGEARPFM